MIGVAQARKHFLTFEGTASNSESPLHSTYAILAAFNNILFCYDSNATQ